MGRFSDDGQWWWDRTTWIATSQIVIPDLGPPQVSADAVQAAHRATMEAAASSVGIAPAPDVLQLAAAGYAAWNFLQRRRTYRLLRELKLAQLAQATAYLLDRSEPIVAAEASLYPANPIMPWLLVGSFAVVVTSAVVLVLESQRPLEAPRYVAMAARVPDIQIQLGRDGLFRFPALFVRRSDRLWTITGIGRVFQPEPVLEAWRRSAGAAQS